MLTLKCLATGSSGNCYLLNSETETLILDCGIPVKEVITIELFLGANIRLQKR